MKNKKILSIILVMVMSVFLFSGCNSMNEEVVQEVAIEFCKAFFIENDFDKAREYCKSDARNFVDENSDFDITPTDDSVEMQYEVDEIEVDGDEATVTMYLRFEWEDGYVEGSVVELDMKETAKGWKIYDIETLESF